MQTTDTSNLFQSDAQHAKAAYRIAKVQLHAESGDPITLASKPLRVVVRQKGTKEADAWCAESGFVVRRVGLESGKTKQIFRGHLGPVTSIDFFAVASPPKDSNLTPRPPREVMVTGSWDKSIRVWDVQTKAHLSTTLAHKDFVKALVVIPSLEVVVTGSSDKDLRIWNLSHLSALDFAALKPDTTPEPVEESMPAPTAEPVFQKDVPVPTGAAPPAPKALAPLPFLLALKGHTRPVERLAYYHVQAPQEGDGADDDGKARATTGAVAVVSVDSLGALKTWELWRDIAGVLQGVLRSEIRPHEIGIYDLLLGDGEIWTASADNSVLLSTFDASSPSTPPVPTLRIPHPAGVKSLLPLALAMPSLNSTHLLTGAVDEAIRIFNLSDLDDLPSTTSIPWVGLPTTGALPGCVREVDGHAHDVMELGVFTKEVDGKREAWIVSASLDCTLRRWRWPDVLKAPATRKVLVPVEEPPAESLLTEEEERELEELMADD